MRASLHYTVSSLLIGLLSSAMVIAPLGAQTTEPFAGASLSFDTRAAEPTNYNVGDWGVSAQKGAAIYTLPIDVPPGRNGMAPSLALRYSSQSPLRGGLAAGWTLDVPAIEIDRSLGYKQGQTFYMASVGSASGPLVEVPDSIPYPSGTAYRVRFDQTFTRFFRLRPGGAFDPPGPRGWVALTPDGVRHFFDEDLTSSDLQNIWNITRQEDPFGNTVRYIWADVRSPDNFVIDHRLQSIEYTANDNAGLEPYVRIDFAYGMDLCVGSNIPIGAASKPGGRNRSNRLSGTQRLDAIQIYVRDTPSASWRLSKEIHFTYTIRSSRLHVEPLGVIADHVPTAHACKQAPLRYLTKVETIPFSPDGSPTSLPPVTFSYNMRTVGPDVPGVVLPPLPGIVGTPSRTIDTPGLAHFGNQQGAIGTLLDVDGDGILDRVSVIEENRVCTLLWQKGQFGGTFEETVRRSPLPTAPWYRETLDPPQAGGALLPDESCNLNGQVAYRPRQVIGGRQPERGMLAYHFRDYTGDGRLDLLTAIWAPGGSHASYVPVVQIGQPLPVAAVAGPEPDPGALPGLDPPLLMTPEKVGLEFMWRVYPNGSSPDAVLSPSDPSAFSIVAMTVRSPVPLPPTTSDEKLDHSVLPNSVLPVLFDLDGDGFLDVIDIGHHPNRIGWHTEGCRTGPVNPTGASWCVYFGNGGTEFSPGYNWPIPPEVPLSQNDGAETTGPDGRKHRIKHTVALLHDINGNGLTDLVVHEEDNQLRAYLNRGNGFATEPLDLQHTGPVESFQTDHTPTVSAVMDGHRGYRRRLVDLDGDGLPDLIYFENRQADDRNNIQNQHKVMAAFNSGDGFLPPVELPVQWGIAKRLFSATSGDWAVISDFFDITGDGLADMVEWTSPTSMKVVERPGLPFAPDLLATVQNGRGMRVAFTYGLTTELLGANPLLPSPRWVVTQVGVDGGHDTPRLVQTYGYADPTFLSLGEASGFDEPARFLGFRRAIVQRRDEDGVPRHEVAKNFLYHEGSTGRVLSPSGLIGTELVSYRRNGQLRLHQSVHNTWERRPLFDGQVHFVHLDTRLTHTCRVGQTETQCVDQTDNVHRLQQTWSPRSASPATTAPLEPVEEAAAAIQPITDPPAPLYVLVASQIGVGPEPGERDRRTTHQYQIRYGQPGFRPDDYRILTVRTDEQEAHLEGTNLVFERHGLTRTIYDLTGQPIRVDRFQNEATIASSRYDYDSGTGNLISHIRPTQAAPGGSGAATIFEYDPHHLFVAGRTNELGHQVHAVTDVATGALLERRGPNSIIIGAPATEVFERETWKIDGLGRILEHHVSLDDDEGYSLHHVSKTTYNDLEFVENGQPVSVRQERLRDFGGNVWLTTEVATDGLGRVLAEMEILEAGQQVVTGYAYDSFGDLLAVDAPDPRTDDGSRVRYEFDHDGLGRLTRFTQPDGNGLSITHDGLEHTAREETGDGSGSTTRQVYDVFGRLLAVHEFDSEGETAITRYDYNANHNLSRILDADDNVTELDHDWLGNRVAITRGERTWRYTYDPNNNLIREIRPVPPGEAPDVFTVAYEYDDLHRVISLRFRDVPGDASEPRSIHYFYDEGHNGLGRLTRVELPFGEIHYAYDARGLLVAEERSFALPAPANVSDALRVERAYNALGLSTLSTWDDGQQWRTTYDDRGLVKTVDWLDPETGQFKAVADYTRSLAGLPRSRESAFGQMRQYVYDALGRPTGDTISTNGATVSTRAYQFNDAGDLANVKGETNGASAAASYTYDDRHRIKAASGPNGYEATFSYSLNGNLLTAHVSWNGSAETRNVRYEYGQVDPQAVDRLVNVVTGEVYANFGYDPSGNMVARNTANDALALHWDGLDQLRLVEGSSGTEAYYYDHNGLRTLAVNDSEVRLWFAESETHYDLAGNQTRRYLHLSNGSTLARVEDATTIELQYADAHQNLMLSVNEAGNVAANFLYGPFGEVVLAAGEEDHRRQFNDKENDRVSGLRYYGARYYDPIVLRWNSADPLYRFRPDLGVDNPQHMNLYSFSLNNPIRFYDPDGRDAEDVLRSFRIPSKSELAALYRFQTLHPSAHWQLTLMIVRAFNLELKGFSPVNIAITPLPGDTIGRVTGTDLHGRGQVLSLELSPVLFVGSSPEEIVGRIVAILAHEVVHTHQFVEPSRLPFRRGRNAQIEMQAALVEVAILEKLYVAGVIDESTYEREVADAMRYFIENDKASGLGLRFNIRHPDLHATIMRRLNREQEWKVMGPGGREMSWAEYHSKYTR